MRVKVVGVLFAVHFLSLSLLLAHAGCSPVARAPRATVSIEAAPPAPSSRVAKADETFVFSAPSSKLQVIGADVLTGKHLFQLGTFSGTLTVVHGVVEMRVEIDMRSLTTNQGMVEDFVKSPNFFDVEQYPNATFVTSSVKRTPKPFHYVVEGDLQMRGLTKRISFPATMQLGPGRTVLRSEFLLRRHDFDIKRPDSFDSFIEPDLIIRMEIDARRARVNTAPP